MHKVKNLNTHRSIPSGYSSWLDYWEKQTGEKVNRCKRQYCSNKATDGAHVKRVDVAYNNWYIVPLCHQHNMQSNEEFYVDGNLVSVNV